METNASILFQTPDGAPFIASYDKKGDIEVYRLGRGQKFPLDMMMDLHPDLCKRIRKQLEALCPWPGAII